MALYLMPCKPPLIVARGQRVGVTPAGLPAAPPVRSSSIPQPRASGWSHRLVRHLLWVFSVSLLLI